MNTIKTFDQFVSDKHSKTTNESLVGTAMATSIMMRKSGSSGLSSGGGKKNSIGARIINAAIKLIFIAGGIKILAISPGIMGLVGLIALSVGLLGGFKDFIDEKILRKKINESLNNEEVELITEGKLKDFFKEKILDVAMDNEKVKKICEEIMKRDDFKEAQKENSIKKLVMCVVSYFKENKNKEKEFERLQSELEDEK